MSSSSFNYRWVSLDCQSVPSARTYASIVKYRRSFILFAGFADRAGRLNDMYEFINDKWTEIQPVNERPKPLYLHTATVIDNKMYVFGGNSLVYSKECNDMHIYDFDTRLWAAVTYIGGFTTIPSPRYGHSAVQLSKDVILIAGGCRDNNSYHKDSWTYNVNTRSWKKLADLPMELAYHTLINHNGRVYCVGGFNGKIYSPSIYHYDGSGWSAWKCSGTIPPPACGSAVCIRQDELWQFGGYTENGHQDTTFKLNLLTAVWQKVNAINPPIARAYMQGEINNDKFFVFGGYTGKNSINDFRVLELPPLPAASNSSSSSSSSSSVTPSSNSLHQLLLSSSKEPPSVDMLLSLYSSNSATQSLTRPQLTQLLKHMHELFHTKPSLPFQPINAFTLPSKSTVPAGVDLDMIESMGFDRAHILHCIDKMVKLGQDPKKVELVVDWCMREPPPPLEMKRQASENAEKTQLKEKLTQIESMMEDKEDEKLCKICFDESINCAFNGCGHLCACVGCATSLIDKGATCPICNGKIASFLKVFWS